MKIMFPPTGFQYLANEIQLEGKDSLLTSVHTLSPTSYPSIALTGMFGQLAFRLCPDTEPAFLRSILKHWNPKWKD